MGETNDTGTLQRDVDALDDLDDNAFRDLVEKSLDTSSGNSSVWKLLCHPTLSDRTWGCLDEMAAELDEVLARRGLRSSSHFKARRLAVVRTRQRQVEAVEARFAASLRAQGGA